MTLIEDAAEREQMIDTAVRRVTSASQRHFVVWDAGHHGINNTADFCGRLFPSIHAEFVRIHARATICHEFHLSETQLPKEPRA